MSAFDRASNKIEQMEAEAEAATELAEEYTGDTLEHKFDRMEVSQGADEDLLALKQQMGLAPAPEPVEEAGQVRVEEQQQDELENLSQQEQDELATALAELEEQEQAEQARMKR